MDLDNALLPDGIEEGKRHDDKWAPRLLPLLNLNVPCSTTDHI